MTNLIFDNSERVCILLIQILTNEGDDFIGDIAIVCFLFDDTLFQLTKFVENFKHFYHKLI
jgi:hypothetical protein